MGSAACCGHLCLLRGGKPFYVKSDAGVQAFVKVSVEVVLQQRSVHPRSKSWRLSRDRPHAMVIFFLQGFALHVVQQLRGGQPIYVQIFTGEQAYCKASGEVALQQRSSHPRRASAEGAGLCIR